MPTRNALHPYFLFWAAHGILVRKVERKACRNAALKNGHRKDVSSGQQDVAPADGTPSAQRLRSSSDRKMLWENRTT